MYLPFNITYEMQALLDKKWSTELSDCIENGINPYVVLYVDRSVIRYVNLLNSEGVYASKNSSAEKCFNVMSTIKTSLKTFGVNNDHDKNA